MSTRPHRGENLQSDAFTSKCELQPDNRICAHNKTENTTKNKKASKKTQMNSFLFIL